jgi:hypothetical protein
LKAEVVYLQGMLIVHSGNCESAVDFVQRPFKCRKQALAHFHVLEGEQRSEPIVYRFFQILLASEIAFGGQN